MKQAKRGIRSRSLVLPEGVRPGCVLFSAGRITSIEPYSAAIAGTEILDFSGCAVLPGLVDSHIHVNEPGRTEWEGFATATRAAAAGGYTCLLDMPLNSVPATTTVEALAQKRAAASGKALVDYAFWGGLVQGNERHLAALAEAGARGFKAFLVHPGIEEFTMVGEEELRRAMPFIASSGLPLLVHAELPGPIDEAEHKLASAGADFREYPSYLGSRPDEAELAAIRLLIRLAREYGCRVHIVHLATAQALPELRAARNEGLPITVETCPHYLYFSSEAIPTGATQYKCAPPIRSAANGELLWDALAFGTIDLIATDHSPCPPEMKRQHSGNFKEAWGGIASVSLALPAVWKLASAKGHTLNDIARWMSAAPAKLAGLRMKGQIAAGFDADFTVFDTAVEWFVTPEDLHFRHKISPYLGERLLGRVKATFVRGECVHHDGQFPGAEYGRECVE